MHDAQAMGEARVLGRREDPARALELADPAEPLEPGGVEQVLLGDVLVGQAGRRRLGGESRLVSSTYPWIGSLMRLTAANGWRRITTFVPAPVASADAAPVPAPVA